MEAGNFRMKVPSVVNAPISKSEVRVLMEGWSYTAKRRNTDTTQALKENSGDGQSTSYENQDVHTCDHEITLRTREHIRIEEAFCFSLCE